MLLLLRTLFLSLRHLSLGLRNLKNAKRIRERKP
nr:MAG TPA: hypothetical protein [Caudoviricetes sp.]